VFLREQAQAAGPFLGFVADLGRGQGLQGLAIVQGVVQLHVVPVPLVGLAVFAVLRGLGRQDTEDIKHPLQVVALAGNAQGLAGRSFDPLRLIGLNVVHRKHHQLVGLVSQGVLATADGQGLGE